MFCIIDLIKAYLLLELSEESQEILTLNTPFGLFKYRKLPFGVSAAPSIFQYVIDNILTGIQHARAYLDDIIIWGGTRQECSKVLKTVVERLSHNNVKVNPGKCFILKKEVKYLGHIFKAGTIGVNPEKFEAVLRADQWERSDGICGSY